MTMRERVNQEEADREAHLASLEEASEGGEKERMETALEPYTAEELLRAAFDKMNKEHTEVQERMIELEEELKKLHERDSELSDAINRTMDALGMPTNDDPFDEKVAKENDEDDKTENVVNVHNMVKDIMTGKGWMKVTGIADLINASYKGVRVNRQKVQLVLQRGKDVFRYEKNKGWKLK